MAVQIVQKRFPDIVADVRGLFGEPRPGSLPFPDDPKIHKACQFVPTFEDLPFHDSIKEKVLPPLHPFAAFDFKATVIVNTCSIARSVLTGRRDAWIGAAEEVRLGKGWNGELQ